MKFVEGGVAHGGFCVLRLLALYTIIKITRLKTAYVRVEPLRFENVTPWKVQCLNEKKVTQHMVYCITLKVFCEPLVGFEPTTPRLQITCSGQLS